MEISAKTAAPVSIGRLNPVAASVRNACIPAGLALFLTSNIVFAGPEGGVVSAGQGDISTPDANTTNINQYTRNLVIDWRTFNIAVDETVQFLQPSSSATALNRIHDAHPSQIFGSLIANGNVFLLNGSGIFFSPTASVNVNSLIASTLNISDDDFMAGNLTFQAPPGQEGGMVVNQGVIEAATGGSVTLMGGAVSNEGVILAHAGQVNLVAGNQVTIDFDGDGLMQFAINKEVFSNARNLDAAVKNSGTIDATGGTVLMAGSAAAEVFTNVVNNAGVVKAGRIENEGGVIRLVATGSGASVINTGTLNADAADSTSDGGTIKITGGNVTQAGIVTANSTGGTGGQVTLQAADTTLVTGNAIISATSITSSPSQGEGGDGGEIGQGGTVHILGDKVGLLDMASIDVSGALGGG
ncbi:MAG: filamentous hemagglutinin N-terminal domain-containing protein, partial [Gammaproteobacteria bacterium]